MSVDHLERGQVATPLTAAILLASVLVRLDKDKDKEGALSPELMVVSMEGMVVMEDVVALEVAVVDHLFRVGVVQQQQIEI